MFAYNMCVSECVCVCVCACVYMCAASLNSDNELKLLFTML